MSDLKSKNISRRILIVEDVEGMLSILAERFAAEGFKVAVARNGQEGLEVATSTSIPPDIILADILMPRMDGIEMAKRLRKEKAAEDIPIVFLSVLNEQEHGEALRELKGNYEFLWKNEHSLEDIVAKVDEVLAKRS